MDIARRDLLSGFGAVGLAAALGSTFPTFAHAAPTLGDAELEALRQRWVDQLTGRHLITDDPAFAEPLAALDRAVSKSQALLGGADRVFTDLGFDKEASITQTYRRLAQFATAWATPQSAHYQGEQLLGQALDGLKDTNRLIYNPDQPEFGNWWEWEIGATGALADAMALLRDHIDQADLDAYCAAMDYYVPDPWYQFPDSRGKQLSEGANRVDLCQAVIIRSIVGGDTARLAHAIDGLSAVWAYVTSGDGFFRDGSFIQHSTIGYTGSYGLVLLRGLSRLFALLAQTSHDIHDPSRVILTESVEASFAPFIYQGQMMDAVRGRAVSRERERSYDAGHKAIEAILQLAGAVDEATAERWRGLCLQWIQADDYRSILEGASITRLALVLDLMRSGVAPRPDAAGPRLFPAMDRLVHRGEGWAVCVAMCSNRIAWYECGNGENDKGYQTSQGMTYLYLPHADGHFDDLFWATSDLTAPPGTTVDTTALPDCVEGGWGDATPSNDWTGGTVLDEMALVGQHLIGPGGTGLQARKTWWCMPDMVVALGSDISTQSGAEVKTVVEHRNLGTTGRRLVVDGADVTEEVELSGARWAHLADVGGYVFLDVAQLRAKVESRQGSWSRNRTSGSTDVHERVYATLEAIHSAASGTYAYILLPGADAGETEAHARSSRVSILANDAAVQALRINKVTAANFWTAAGVGDYSVSGPASLLVRHTPGMMSIAISDPTQNAAQLDLVVRGVPFRRVEGGDGVTLHEEADGIRLTVDVAGRAGVPVSFKVHR